MRFQKLADWLAWQENLHFTKVAPGLDRVGMVHHALYPEPPDFKVVTIAGTNGKGSSVALLQSILTAAGYRVGTYTSPHLLRYNERICIDSIPCDDTQICGAFAAIDDARGDTSLTYFEFGTLAAITLFHQEKVDIAIMEVGMGGRLDAANILDADIALITPISLDHTQWLGDTREKIGHEKAGVIRAGAPVVCAERNPPQSVLDYAKTLAAPLYQSGKEFSYRSIGIKWHWKNSAVNKQGLARPQLAGDYQLQNSAAVLQVISLLNLTLGFDVSSAAIAQGLQQVKLAGRFQQIEGDIARIFDVTHNAQGATNLAVLLAEKAIKGKTFAVLGMLKDKDAQAVATRLMPQVDDWFVGGLSGERGCTGSELAEQLAVAGVPPHMVTASDSVEAAYTNAMAQANTGDRVLIFGSFHTVEAVMRAAGLAADQSR